MLYVTERCVFRLTPDGLELTEIAPGIDIERDILGQDGFQAADPARPVLMDPRIFRREPMGLRDAAARSARTALPLRRATSTVFRQSRTLRVAQTRPTSSDIRQIVADRLARSGETRLRHRQLRQFLHLAGTARSIFGDGARPDGHYYSGVTRYTTSGFLRMKLGDALEKRGVAPHIFESAKEAHEDLMHLENGLP